MSERDPISLWKQAQREHPTDAAARALRYVALMKEAGHIVERGEGEDGALPCGWDPFTAQQREHDTYLSDMAKQRQQAEARHGHEPMP